MCTFFTKQSWTVWHWAVTTVQFPVSLSLHRFSQPAWGFGALKGPFFCNLLDYCFQTWYEASQGPLHEEAEFQFTVTTNQYKKWNSVKQWLLWEVKFPEHHYVPKCFQMRIFVGTTESDQHFGKNTFGNLCCRLHITIKLYKCMQLAAEWPSALVTDGL